MAATLRLAERHEITFYDASYLWLAAELEVPLISLDARLAALSNRAWLAGRRSGARPECYWIGTRNRDPRYDSTAPSAVISSTRSPLGSVSPSFARAPLTNTKRALGFLS